MDTQTAAVFDTAGRYLAPADVALQARPAGPWDANTPLVTVCAWCVDASAKTAAATAAGYQVSHGLCASCEAIVAAEWSA